MTEPAPVVLLTGAAGGLGRVTAEVLVAEGFRVALVDVDAGRLEQVEAALPTGSAQSLPCDLTREDDVAAVVGGVRSAFGRLDVLVNNAAIEPPMNFEDADLAAWDATMAINLRAPMMLVKHCTPGWRAQGGGTVVCVGSRTWSSGSSGPAYVASKAALVGLVRAITSHLGPIGVNANVVAPSFVHTPLNRQKMTAEEIDNYAERFIAASPLRRLITPVDVANTVAFLASSRARNISGEVVHVAAGSQLAPSVR